MSVVLSELSGNLPVEIGPGILIANAIALAICFAGFSLWFRWLFPLFKGNLGREPVCFRQTAKSSLKISPPSPPVLLAGFLIALQLFLAFKNELAPQQTVDSLPDLNKLFTNAIFQIGIVLFLFLLWEFASERGKLLDYFRVDHWKKELQAGAELMLLVMPWTLLLGLISNLWKTPEDMHPLLQLLQEGEIELIIGIGITAVLIAPLAEEFLFRVLLLNGLIDLTRLNRLSAWLVVSACFCLAHGTANALQLLPLSMALGWCMIRRQSYLAVVVAHALFNALMLLIAILVMES